ncbi:hypothetical protein N9A28_07425 [Sulfurimonas sp.]|nr:hypothetical protein [Sulfurimonas sp.]
MNLIKIISTSSLILIFNACSSTPESAVTNTFDALKYGHFPKLMKNTTYPISKAYSARALKNCSVDKLKYKSDDLELMHLCLIEEYKDIKVEKTVILNVTKDEAQAEVTVMYDKKVTHKFGIANIEGQWRLTPPKEKNSN